MGRFLTRRRPVVAIALAIVAVAVIVIALASGGGDSAPDTETSAATDQPTEAPPGGAELEELVDGVILAGFDGTSPDDGVADEVGDHELGGVLIQELNSTAAG